MSSTRRRRKLLYGWLQELGVGRGLAGPWLCLGGHGVRECAHALGESPKLLPLLALQAELDISLVVGVLHPHLQRVQAVLDLHDLTVPLLNLSSEQTNKQHFCERNVLFNDTLNTFYLQLYGVRHMVKDHSDNKKGNFICNLVLLDLNSEQTNKQHLEENSA